MDESNQKTAETYTSFREKFYQLEVFYDQQSEELRQELAECVKRFEEQQAIENVKKAQVNFMFDASFIIAIFIKLFFLVE